VNPISLLGWALEGLGLIVTALGVVSTFRKSAPGTPLFSSQRAALRGVRDRAAAMARRLTRRGTPKIVNVGLAGAVTVSSTLRARVKYGRLRSGDVPSAVRELERRTNIAWTQLADLRDKVDDEIARLDAANKDLEGRISQRLDEIDEEARKVASSDVETQVVGLGLIGLGFLLQTIGINIH
jgi:hypothetical protein